MGIFERAREEIKQESRAKIWTMQIKKVFFILLSSFVWLYSSPSHNVCIGYYKAFINSMAHRMFCECLFNIIFCSEFSVVSELLVAIFKFSD